MRGAGKNGFRNQDMSVQISVRIQKHVRDMIPPGTNISQVFEEFILVRYSDAASSQLEGLIMKEKELIDEISSVRNKILEVETRIKQREDR